MSPRRYHGWCIGSTTIKRICTHLALGALLATGSVAAEVQADEQETALIHAGEQLRGQGNFTQADVSFELARQLAERDHQPARVADALRNLGMDARLQQRYTQALEYFRASRAIGEQIGDQGLIARAEGGIGAAAAQSGDFDTSLAAFNHARQIAESSGDRGQLGRVLANLGTVAQLQGNLAAARSYTEQSLQIEKAEKFPDSDIATLFLNLGAIAANQGDNARALANYRASLSLLGDSDSTQQAILLNNIAMIYRGQGQYDQAVDYARRALALSGRISNREEIASAYGTLASTYRDQNELMNSLESFQQSLAIYQEIGNKRDAAFTLSALGDVLTRLHRYAGAQQVLEEAHHLGESLHLQVITAESLLGLAQLRYRQHRYRDAISGAADAAALMDRIENRPDLWLARTVVGQSWVELGKRARARQAFAQAINDIEALRDRVAGGHESRASFFSGALTPYHGMMALLVAQNRPTEALQYAERAKGRALLDALVQSHLSAAQAAAPLSSREMTQAQPDTHGATLEYVVTEDRTYLFVVTPPAHVQVYTLKLSAAALDKSVQTFREQLAARNLDVRSAAAEFFRQLLAPAWSTLSGQTQLLIVPDGSLWDVPFQALVDDRGRYLIEDHAIAYAPSLTVLREMRQLRNRPSEVPPSERTLLVFADPDLGNTSESATLEPLPEARREAESLQALYGASAKIRVGADARESTFKSEAGQFRILHLATHGVLNDVNPMYSNLRLTPEDDGKEDGLLEAREIMGMHLHADLAVLSACETGRGHIRAGEGVMGLAWAFFVAGTPTTVVSLWNVESVNTSDLMLEFHRNLWTKVLSGQNSLQTAQALRQAQLHLLRSSQSSHPFYWAGFSTVGVPD